MTNASVLFQAYQPDSAIYLSNVTNAIISPDYYLTVYALEGGLVDLHQLSSVSGGSFNVLSRTTGSVVDLTGLSGLTPRVPGTSLNTQSGGLILLNDTALLLANVALNFETSPNSILPATTNAGAAMVLYGRTWHAYRIEAYDTRLANAPWTTYLRVAMTNSIQTIAPLPPAHLAFRVTELLAEPPEVDILRAAPQQTQLIVFGVPGQSYRFESKSVLSNTVAWTPGVSVTLTNAFTIRPPAASAESARYYRARKL